MKRWPDRRRAARPRRAGLAGLQQRARMIDPYCQRPGPNRAGGPLAAGVAAFRCGQLGRAIARLAPLAGASQRGCTAARYLGWAHLVLGMLYQRLRAYEPAVRHLEAARCADRSLEVSRPIVCCHLRRGRADLACVELQRLVERRPGDAEAWIGLAMLQCRLGRSGEAIGTLRRAASLLPQVAAIHLQLGTILAAEEQFDEAEQALLEAARLEPDDGRTLQQLGLCRAARGNIAGAVEALSRAAVLLPGERGIAEQLGLARRAMGDHGGRAEPTPQATPAGASRSQSELARTIGLQPELIAALLSETPGPSQGGLLQRVLEAVTRAALERPRLADLHYWLGRLCKHLGYHEAAAAETRRALRINPNYVEALIQLAGLYQHDGRCDQAIKALERAVGCGGDFADVHFALGRLYQATGRRQQARDAYERALRVNANYAAARRALAALAA